MPRLLPLLFVSVLLLPCRPGLSAEADASSPAAAAVAKLRSPQPTYSDWQAILAVGKPAVPELQKLLGDPSEPVQARAAVLLYRLGEASALDKLAALLDAKDDDARREAADALRAFIPAPLEFDPAAPDGERAKALEAWRTWWKANRAEALKVTPMNALSARLLTVDPAARLVALTLSVRHGAKRGMQFNVARGDQPVCLVEIVAAGDEASVARIIELSERRQPRVGDRAFWISK